MPKTPPVIKDTDKARNLQVAVDGALSLDAMEQSLLSVADSLSLTLTHVTMLSRKKYPGNRHWHFKQDPKARGCLDVTYWPGGPLFWITARHYEPDWVQDMATRMRELMRRHLPDPQ